ncbi:MAG TPA: hypothetical protein VLG40_00760 [Candidatus Saccharimonas sp.]|nr:hypothetical protein [Candidatus Saccharimonas sp.]
MTFDELVRVCIKEFEDNPNYVVGRTTKPQTIPRAVRIVLEREVTDASTARVLLQQRNIRCADVFTAMIECLCMVISTQMRADRRLLDLESAYALNGVKLIINPNNQ